MPGDVVVRKESLEAPLLKAWKEWAFIAQSQGTPCIVQLAHPGRMSPKGAGLRPGDMPTICPSSVPVELGDRWVDKKAVDLMLGTPREATLSDIDEAVDAFVTGAKVAYAAGFSGVQIHGAVRLASPVLDRQSADSIRSTGFLSHNSSVHTRTDALMNMAVPLRNDSSFSNGSCTAYGRYARHLFAFLSSSTLAIT